MARASQRDRSPQRDQLDSRALFSLELAQRRASRPTRVVWALRVLSLGRLAEAPKGEMVVEMAVESASAKTIVLHLLGSPTSMYYEELCAARP